VCNLSNGAIEWPQPKFQGHNIIQHQVTRKCNMIELYLQWQMDRKSYMVYEILPFSLNLTQLSKARSCANLFLTFGR